MSLVFFMALYQALLVPYFQSTNNMIADVNLDYYTGFINFINSSCSIHPYLVFQNR